jgi:hypothetical protein
LYPADSFARQLKMNSDPLINNALPFLVSAVSKSFHGNDKSQFTVTDGRGQIIFQETFERITILFVSIILTFEFVRIFLRWHGSKSLRLLRG